VIKLCTKFERNRTICGGVIAISMYNLDAVRHLGFDRKWVFFAIARPMGTINAPVCQISIQQTNAEQSRVSDDSINFQSPVFRGNFERIFLRVGESDPHQSCGRYRSITCAPKHLLDCGKVASFRNQSALNRTCVKIDAKFWHFFTPWPRPCKN